MTLLKRLVPRQPRCTVHLPGMGFAHHAGQKPRCVDRLGMGQLFNLKLQVLGEELPDHHSPVLKPRRQHPLPQIWRQRSIIAALRDLTRPPQTPGVASADLHQGILFPERETKAAQPRCLTMPASIALAPQKNLRTGHSVWSDTPHKLPKTLALKGSLRCDVAIVGAGVSGAFMADALSRQYGNVVVLDRRPPAGGSTHASTAMLQFEIDTPLIELADRIGHARAVKAWQISYRATQKLIRMVRGENIVCDLQNRDALYLSGDRLGGRAMQREAKARNRAGLSCDYLSGAVLKARYGIDRTAAIYSAGSAVADPVALTYGLLRRAMRRGARLFSPVNVCGVMSTGHGVVLDAGSHFIEAGKVVFCTGYEIVPGLKTKAVKVTSSWAAATAPRAAYPQWLDRTLVWEAAEPYLYMRTDGKGRLIVGGEDADLDSPIYRAQTLGLKSRKLAAKTTRLLGVKPDWTHIWAGAFGESADGLPLIGEVPGLKNCFAVMGFGGNGTIYSMIAAGLMPGLLKGRTSEAVRLFAFR